MIPSRNPDLAMVLVLYAGGGGGLWIGWLCRNGADRDPVSTLSPAELAEVSTGFGVIGLGTAILFTAEGIGIVERSSTVFDVGLILALALGVACTGLWGIYRLGARHRRDDDAGPGEPRPVHPSLGVVRVIGSAVFGTLLAAGLIVGQFSPRRRDPDPSLFSLYLGYGLLAVLLFAIPVRLAQELRRREKRRRDDRPPSGDPSSGW